MADQHAQEPNQAEAGSSSATLPPPAPSIPPARPANSLFLYFGNGSSRPTSSASSSVAAPLTSVAKTKRSKAVASDQARLGTTAAEGSGSKSGWALETKKAKEGQEAEVKPKPKTRKKAVKADGGEEAERKEMARRSKVEKDKGKGKGKGTSDSLEAGEAESSASVADSGDGGQKSRTASTFDQPAASGSQSAVIKPIPPGPRTSDTKRKRSHHHPQQRAQSSLPIPSYSHPSSQASNPRSTPAASSPPTITLSSTTESSDDDGPKSIKAAKLPRSSPSVIHPLFSRSSSAISKGASQDDAIDIDDSPKRPKARVVIDLADSPQAKIIPGPKKTVLGADKKGMHGFFGMKRGAPSAPLSVEGASASQAKVAIPRPPVNDKVHAFFQAGPKGVPGKLGDGWGGDRKMGEEWPAPFPGRKWPSHLGYSDLPIGPLGQLRKRRRYSPSPADPLPTFFSGLAKRNPPTSGTNSRKPPATLPRVPNIDHSAIRSVAERSLASNQETWCERYRPLTAAQVLGNEGEAAYLRDWLQLLSVGQDGAGIGSATAPKVTRRVPGKKAQLLDGWIVEDINDFDDDGDNPDDVDPDQPQFEAFEYPPSAIDARPETYPPFSERLANTILLSGPHGSGKSAAVYAVAEELGWEVFEVYPGIGKRTGGNLMSLVGDVGRNHVIAGKGKGKVTPKKAKTNPGPEPGIGLGGGTGIKPKSAAGSFFKNVAVAAATAAGPAMKSALTAGKGNGVARKRANQLPSSSQGSQDDPMRLDDSDDDEKPGSMPIEANGGGEVEVEVEVEVLEDRKHGFRETLILLDEADLLFEEEASFWPSVIAFIAESRRPIVITCNDPEQIPIKSLPLQAMLEFQPPPRPLALSLLSAIAAHESLSLAPGDIEGLYDSAVSGPLDLLDQPTPLAPNGYEPVPMFDLRRAITQMQLDRARSSSVNVSEGGALELKDLYEGLEGRSFIDACVGPRSWATKEINEIDRYTKSPDDFLAVYHLPKPEVHPDRPILAICSAEREIGDYIHSLIPVIPDTFPSEVLGLKQTYHMRALLPLLDPLIPLTSNLLPHFSLFTEYIPTLRSMVIADDMMEMAEEAALASGGERHNRKTGRPVRTVTGWLKGKEEGEYVRYLKEAGKEGEAVVRDIRLGGA